MSDISSIHSMEVDEGGAPIRNPKAENYVPKMPLLDGGKMSKGRRSEIEAWVFCLGSPSLMIASPVRCRSISREMRLS